MALATTERRGAIRELMGCCLDRMRGQSRLAALRVAVPGPMHTAGLPVHASQPGVYGMSGYRRVLWKQESVYGFSDTLMGCQGFMTEAAK